MKSIVKFSLILLTILLFSTVQNARMETIDSTQVGVEVGDWFVYQIKQGNSTFLGEFDPTDIEVGDLITITITGFTDNNVTVKSEHKGNSKDLSMSMESRTDSYILFTDWGYWDWQINASWGPRYDALKNSSFLAENGIVEAFNNYNTTDSTSTFNSTMELHMKWDDNTELFHVQKMNWIKATGNVDYLFVNSTTFGSDGSVDKFVSEITMVSRGKAITSKSSSSKSPFFYSFSVIAIITAVYFRKR